MLTITDKANPLFPDGVKTMALTIWGEARGASFQGRIAVAHVILNRVRKGGWWGSTIEEVCTKPWQFSCWNKGDPNRAKMEAVKVDDPIYLQCLGISIMLLSGPGKNGLPNLYGREFPADVYHYCTKSLYESAPPEWARDRAHDFAVGEHYFFSGVG